MERRAHLEISKKAIELYKELNPSKSEQSKEWTALFIDGSGKEDELDISLQRLFNWHFYDRRSGLGHAWWGARKSNTKRFEDLAEKLIQSAGNCLPGTPVLAGRLAHHIQDMSSPPHVVPVYHMTDPFDEYATARIADVKLTPVQLAVVRNEKRKISFEILIELLENEAKKTILRVESPVIFDGEKIADDWTEFWRKYELTGAECGRKPHKHFGCYGKNKFGKEAGQFTRAVYDLFYKEQIASAIGETLRLLILLHGID
jgi:hypothetical protein